MVLQKFLATNDVLLSQRKKKRDNDNTILGGLVILILIRNFYQYLPMLGKLLWEKAITTNKFYSKAI